MSLRLRNGYYTSHYFGDIKELLVKVMKSRHINMLPWIVLTRNFGTTVPGVSESVISMDYANNLIVIRTIVAGAQAAASAIDSMNWPEIIGCIAGDDTILVIVRDNSMVPDVLKQFSKLMKKQ